MTLALYGALSAISFGVLTSLQVKDVARRGRGGSDYNVWTHLGMRLAAGLVWLVTSYLALPLVGGDLSDIWKLALLCWVPVFVLEVLLPRVTQDTETATDQV